MYFVLFEKKYEERHLWIPEEVHVEYGGRHKHGEDIEEGHNEDPSQPWALQSQEVVVQLDHISLGVDGRVLIPLSQRKINGKIRDLNHAEVTKRKWTD